MSYLLKERDKQKISSPSPCAQVSRSRENSALGIKRRK